MPSRLLREGILDSEAVNALSFAAEIFYRRLMSVVDDYGRFDGRPSFLRSRLYPLKIDTVRVADITCWIAECEKAGLIAQYAVDGKPYLLFHKLGSPRAKESKFPAPVPAVARPPDPNRNDSKQMFADVNGCKRPQTDENNGLRLHTDVPYSGSGSGSNPGSGAGAGSTPQTAPPPVEPPTPDYPEEPGQVVAKTFDPLRAEQAARKLFERQWAAAGLRKCSYFSPVLQGRLRAMLEDAWWAANYAAAIAKAGTISYLARGINDHTGATRVNGPLDTSEFLSSLDVARKILDGVMDDHGRAKPGAGSPDKTKQAAEAGKASADAAAALRRKLECQNPKPGTTSPSGSSTTGGRPAA